MTFSVSRDGGLFEWAGSNLRTIFCQPSRLLDPNMWRLIYDVVRFNACSRRLIIGRAKDSGAEVDTLSIGEYLDREGYSKSFRDNYLIVSELLMRPSSMRLMLAFSYYSL
jgi:predicted NAD/FAD-binding protein